MFNGEKITKLLEDRKQTKKNLFTYVGITGAGLDNMIANGNMRANNLERIADFFKVSIDYFFDREIDEHSIKIGHQVNGNGIAVGDITLSECQKEIDHLKQLLVEKNIIIEEKERTIQILMKQQ